MTTSPRFLRAWIQLHRINDGYLTLLAFRCGFLVFWGGTVLGSDGAL